MKEIVEFEQGFKPKGKVKVQLFDENGKIINEQKSENFISKAVMENLFTTAMRDVFTRRRGTGGHETFSLDPFSVMELTNATHPESPETEFFRAGDLIGYAFTTGVYSGDDTLRGSYNLIESFTNREQVHIVIDFPTHSGIGTFQSIYFTASYSSLNTSTSYRSTTQSFYKLVKHNNKIYGFTSAHSNGTLHIVNRDLDIEESIALDKSYYDFCIVGNTIYFIYGSEVFSAPINDPSNYSLVTTLDNSCRGIGYNPKTGRWFTLYSRTLYMYDNNWELLSTYDIPRGNSNDKIIEVNDEGVITASGYFVWIGGDYDGLAVSLHGDSGISSYSLSGIIDDYLYYYYSFGSSSGIHRMPMVNIGSRALLDEPVTKGNTQTMKITYDFMLPPEL